MRMTRRSILSTLAPAAALLAAALAASPAIAQTTLTFQQGVGGYNSVLDTRIVSTVTTDSSAATTIGIDGGASAYGDASWSQALFRFDNLYGAGVGQIPLNATITSASLAFVTGTSSNDQSGNSFGMYRLNSGFAADATWANSFGGNGIQTGVETAAADSVRAGGAQGTTVTFDVLGSLNFWKSQVDANAANFGWALSTVAGTDAWTIGSSNNGNSALRPLLSVTYLIPQNLTWNVANLTGTWDSGNAANQVWTNNATTLPAAFNNTDNAFFSQNPASLVDVTVSGASPSTMTVSHTAGTYAFSGGSISSLLTKTGDGTLVFNAQNSFSAANLAGGTTQLNAPDALGITGAVTLSGGATLHPTTSASTDQLYNFNETSTIQVDTGNEFRIFGATGGAGTLNKTGAGTLEFRGTTAFTGALNVQGGSVLLTNPAGGGGDLNVTTIAIQNGALFQFGSTVPAAEENPDLPGSTMITVNSGGTAAFTVGEAWGGVNLNGGTFNHFLANTTQTSSWGEPTAQSNLASGDINGNSTVSITAAHTANKTTAGTVTVSGVPLNVAGTLNVQQGTLSTDSLISGSGSMTIGSATDNATLQLRATAPINYTKTFDVGDAGATLNVSEAAGDVTWSGAIGGTTGALTKSGPGKLTVTGLNTTTGPMRVTGGVLSVGGIGNGGQAGPLGASSNSAANLVLDGGSLQYTGASATSNRGSTLGDAGGSFEVSNAGSKVTLTGTTVGSGPLTKMGPGNLVLGGTNQYTGATTIAEGTLTVAPFAALGGFTVNTGATLGVQVPSLASTLSMPTLSLPSGGGSLDFVMQTTGVPTSSLVNVTGPNGLTLNGGTQTINVQTATPLTVGTYKLIDYSGSSITSGFSIGTISGRATSNLIYNTADTRIDLQVTATDSIKWKGNVDGTWDVGTAANVGGTNNWTLNSNSSATNFIAGDIVTFDDTAANFHVSLAADANPGEVTVNNSVNSYAFQGSGKITGDGALVKSGTGTLTLETDNDYTGNTTINAGTLQLGNGGGTGSVGTGALVNNAALVVNRSDNFTLNIPVSGGGSLTKLGSNTLTLNNSFGSTGFVTIDAGSVEALADQPMTIAGNVDGNGSIIKNGGSILTLDGNNTYGGGTTINSGTVVAANSTGSATGTGTTTLAAGTTLQIGNGATAGSVGGNVDSGPAGSTGSIVIDRTDDFAIPANIAGAGPIVKNGTGKASLTGNLSNTGTMTVNAGTLSLAPASDFTHSNTVNVAENTLEINSSANLRFNNPVNGTGNIVKAGTGRVILNGNSGFTGTLTVNGGEFVLQDDQSTAGFAGDFDAEFIVVNNGGEFQFGSGQTITGENPDLPGNTYITVNAGGVIDWYIGEDFGGMHIKGGTVNLRANNNYTSTLADNIWESGVVNAPSGTPAVGNVGVINKTTGGTITVTGVNLNNTGGLNIQDGTLSTNAGITNTGTLTFGTNGVGATTGTLVLANTSTGTVTASTKPVVINAGGGVINVSTAGKTYNYNGAVSGTGNFTKDGPGILALGSGSNSYVGTTTVNAGTLLVNGTHNGGGAYTVANGATLGGTGTIGSTVNVNAGGILAPGASVGTLAVSSANISGKLNVEYNGDTSTIDLLNLTGALSLTGATVDFDNLGVAALGGAGPYVFASYGTLAGTFSSVLDLPAGFSINYNYNGLKQIALVPGMTLHPGDFDSDGDVDGADFVAWQTNFPKATGGTLAQGDADGDQDVDGADFVVWQTNFPFTPGPGASPVPEPQTIALLVFGGLFALAGRYMKRRSK